MAENDTTIPQRRPAVASDGDARPSPSHNICCDGCGVGPILGTRYKSTRIFDFDVCHTCLTEDIDAYPPSDFVAFDTPVLERVARTVGPAEDNTIRANSPKQAYEHELFWQADMEQTAVFEFSIDHSKVEEYEKLASALARNTNITYVLIHMCGISEHGEEAIPILAGGIAENKHILRLGWHIHKSYRSKTVRHALQNMIEQNGALRGLYLMRSCHSRTLAPIRGDKDVTDAEDLFWQHVISKLHCNGTIRRIRVESSTRFLSETCRELLLDAARANPALVKVYANFQDATNLSELSLVLDDNQHKWSDRLWQIRKAPLSERARFLDSVQTTTQLSDSAPLVYYLLRKYPDILEP